MQAQLLNCTAAILQVSEEDCAGISQLLFNLLITVLCQNEETHGQVLTSGCTVSNKCYVKQDTILNQLFDLLPTCLFDILCCVLFKCTYSL